MSIDKIEQYINNELMEDERDIALEFVQYLRDKKLTFYKDNCECFIAIKDPEEKDNHWTVWSADMGSECLAQCQVDEDIKEHAWERVDHCGHCGSCGGGRTKVIFGKKFDDVCGCTFRFDNPDRMDLEVLKVIVDSKIILLSCSEIDSILKLMCRMKGITYEERRYLYCK